MEDFEEITHLKLKQNKVLGMLMNAPLLELNDFVKAVTTILNYIDRMSDNPSDNEKCKLLSFMSTYRTKYITYASKICFNDCELVPTDYLEGSDLRLRRKFNVHPEIFDFLSKI